jgi:hypothetical protein
MNILVKPVSVDTESFNVERAMALVMGMMAKAEILEDLGKLEIKCAEESRLSSHAEHLGSEIGDASCELFDMLFKEQSRQEAESESGEN